MVLKTARSRKLKFGENAHKNFFNILVNNQKVDMNDLLNLPEKYQRVIETLLRAGVPIFAEHWGG